RVNAVPQDPVAAKWQWAVEPQIADFGERSGPEMISINLVIPVADAQVNVKVTDAGGMPIEGVGVALEPPFISGAVSGPLPTPRFDRTNSLGRVTFWMIPGSYRLRAFLPPERGYMNPAEKMVEIKSSEAKDYSMVFESVASKPTASVGGTTALEDGTLVDAFVWAWAEKGGFTETRANSKGQFVLNLPIGDKWHIGAGREINGFPYKSAENVVEPTAAGVTINLQLPRTAREPLPPPVVVTQSATQPIIAQSQDGAKVVVPEQAAASGGTVQVNFTPTVEAPSQEGARLIGKAYDVSVKDEGGKFISSLNKEVEITLPYDEKELEKQGVSLDKVAPSYYDDKTGTWVKLDNFTIDKKNKVFVVKVKHLTRFALVAPADIVPPSAPSKLQARLSGVAEVTLAWVNPQADFHHVKVYRSEAASQAGTAVDELVTSSNFRDAQVKVGSTYYYALKSVDAAGNESVATTPLTVKVTGKVDAGAAVSKIATTLKRGSRSAEVKSLQQILIDQGFLVVDAPTTYFGPATEAAVINFQKAKGIEPTGVVGPQTRTILNSLLAESGTVSAGTVTPSPGRFVSALTRGQSGEEVKALQQLLIKLGFLSADVGATSYFGSLTEAAVKDFQRSKGLEPVGLVGPQTRAALNSLP
ncbi:MAG: peptidoglycan-binding protein, partial [Patescibacteria group bacterium]